MPGDRALRWAAALATFIVAAVVTYWSYEWADPYPPGVGSFLDSAEDSLREDGYGIVVFCLAVVLIGALLQAPVAVRRDADVGRGLLAVLGLVAFMLVVAWLATFLAGTAPDYRAGAGRHDPGGLYGAALVCLLGTPALLVVTGAVFEPRDSKHSLASLIGVAGLIGGMIGTPCVILLGTAIALRDPAVRAWIPSAGEAFVYLGAIAAGGLSVLAVAVAVSGWLQRGLPAREMQKRGAGGLALAAVAGYFAVTGLLGAQLGRFLPGWLVVLLAFVWLLGSGPGMAWFFWRFSRGARRPSGAR